MVLLIQIGLGAQWTEKALLDIVSVWDQLWYLGLAGNMVQWHRVQKKLNI